MEMTVEQIDNSPLADVRTFIDGFALTADLKNPAHVDILHAAKSRICREECRTQLAALRAAAVMEEVRVNFAAAQEKNQLIYGGK